MPRVHAGGRACQGTKRTVLAIPPWTNQRVLSKIDHIARSRTISLRLISIEIAPLDRCHRAWREIVNKEAQGTAAANPDSEELRQVRQRARQVYSRPQCEYCIAAKPGHRPSEDSRVKLQKLIVIKICDQLRQGLNVKPKDVLVYDDSTTMSSNQNHPCDERSTCGSSKAPSLAHRREVRARAARHVNVTEVELLSTPGSVTPEMGT